MAAARLHVNAGTDEFGGDHDLFEIIKERSYRKGRFILSSGAESDHYFDLKPTMMDPHGNTLAAEAFLRRTTPEGVDYVGGLEMGAVPIVGAVSVLAYLRNIPLRTYFVRKAAKGHGTQKTIEGLTENESLVGRRVWVVDDVATKGNSIMQAVRAVRDQGADVDTALVLLDREEGAEELLKAGGVRLLSVFQWRQFI